MFYSNEKTTLNKNLVKKTKNEIEHHLLQQPYSNKNDNKCIDTDVESTQSYVTLLQEYDDLKNNMFVDLTESPTPKKINNKFIQNLLK